MKNLKALLLLIPFLSIAIFNCVKEGSKTITNPDIIEGEGLKGIKIGGTAQQAIDLCGYGLEQYYGLDNQIMHRMDFKKGFSIHCEQTADTIFRPELKIEYISVYSPFFGRTSKNIGIGSKRTDVIEAYGQPFNIDGYGEHFENGLTIIYQGLDDVAIIEVH